MAGADNNVGLNVGLVADCEALLASRDALAGTATLNWSESTPIGQWEGVRLAGSPTRVIGLVLWNAGLTGNIPEALSRLSELQELSLVGNELTGEISAELGGLAKLEWLWLQNNQLIGDIPPELGGLANLGSLHLGSNHLSGEIPPELGNLDNLQTLSLSENKLTGEIPPDLGGLADLQELIVSHNQLTGEMPQRLTELRALNRIAFRNNAGLCAPVDDVFQVWLQSIPTAIGSSCAPMDSIEDRDILVELYNTLDGDNWYRNANWLSTKPLREWQGVTNDATGRVDRLYLAGNRLSGGDTKGVGWACQRENTGPVGQSIDWANTTGVGWALQSGMAIPKVELLDRGNTAGVGEPRKSGKAVSRFQPVDRGDTGGVR